jgi:hypothetical protein
MGLRHAGEVAINGQEKDGEGMETQKLASFPWWGSSMSLLGQVQVAFGANP